MNRSSLRTAAVAAGFVAVSLVVAGTAAGMVGTPADAPVASAVQLTQEDPESLTPAIEAPDSTVDPAALAAAPVEVGSPAIRCSDDGVCDRPSRSSGGDRDGDRAHRDATAPAPASKPQQTRDCDRSHQPRRPSWGADGGAWERAFEEWAAQWQAMAEQCGWHPGDRHAAPDVEPWPKRPGHGGDQGHHEDASGKGDPRESHGGTDGHSRPDDAEQSPWRHGDDDGWREDSGKHHPWGDVGRRGQG